MKKTRTSVEGREITIRIVVKDFPAGVACAVQRGKSELLEPVSRTEAELVFDVPVRAVARPEGGAPNILGPYAQGPASDRFLYLNSGTMAAQADTPWTRRAKIKTAGIGWALVEQAQTQGGMLAVEIDGRAGDGGPCCGTVPLRGGGWRVLVKSR